MESIDLKNATADQLIEELIRRGAKKVNAGPYCEYQLKRKYSMRDRAELKCSVLLLPENKELS